MSIKNFLIFTFLFCCAIFSAPAQSQKNKWVDSVFISMDLDDKIGQLFMLTVTPENYEDVQDEIKSRGIGGVVFKSGGPVWQVKQIKSFQKTSKIPLLIGVNSQWAPGVSVDSAVNLPNALMLGAMQQDSLVYSAARIMGRSMSELGFHINFDVPAELLTEASLERKNQMFGSNSQRVGSKAVMYMKGLRDEGILSVPQHFTLKGLTINGIQNKLPLFTATIDSVTAYPFLQLIKNDVAGILPSPVGVPLFYQNKGDVKKNKLSTAAISSLFTGEWMRQNMGFKGLAFVDIDQAREATDYAAGEAEALAVQGANDMMISSENVGPALRKIKRMLRKDDRYLAQIDTAVKHILRLKYDEGLAKPQVINTDNLVKRISATETLLLKQKLFQSIVTIVHDKSSLLPIRSLENKKIALVSNATNEMSAMLHKYLSKYTLVANFTADEKSDEEALQRDLAQYDVIIAAAFPNVDGEKFETVLKANAASHAIIVADFGNDELIRRAAEFTTAIVTAYDADQDIVKSVAQVIFGALPAKGILPYTISAAFQEGTGIQRSSLNRLGYSIPEDVGMDGTVLNRIDSIAKEAIRMGATPGCHVLVARQGKVVFERSYGHLTYEKKTPVTDQTIYDLASVTKVSATLQSVMFLYDRHLINVNKKASYYLPELRNSNKKDFTLKDILTHQSGLWPFLLFWTQTVKDTTFLPSYYSKVKSDQYPFPVSKNLYASAHMKDSLWSWIIKAKVRDKVSRTPFDYRYSDMGFYVMQHLSEKILNQPMDDFLRQNLYDPLGAATTGFLPLERFPAERIAPTENDKIFRKSLLVGYVHDQGAAMHGGVAGHAGLFSTANDLAKLCQMLLQEGSYGGYQFYRPETVRAFTQRTFDTSRRGLGWDKPTPSDPNGPTSLYASAKTFGHTGFTGTCIWVDPEFDLVYIFLSNRVHPDMTNNKLINANIRPRIQDVIYESIFNYCRF